MKYLCMLLSRMLPSNEHFAGLYLNAGCDGFQVEENYFYNSDGNPFSGNDSTIGIVVNNSGAVSNEVYNNYFEDLDFGVSAQGTNKGESTGLQVKCNDFDSCEYNIVVVPDSCVGIYDYQGSDTALATGSANNLFSYMGSIEYVDAKYQLAIEYLWLGDTSTAMNTLDSIPFKFTLNNYQTAQHTDYEDYFNWIIEIIADGRDVFSADSTEIKGLYDIYNNASGKPKSLTRNLLIQIDALSYHEPYYFPTFYKSSKIAFPENRQNNENKYLFIYPNPSNSYYYVECKLEKEFYNSLVTISDINGRLIDEILVDCQSIRTIIDARSYKPGLYVGRLYSEGKLIESEKFIIIH